MTRDLRPRRLLLSTADLELLRRQALPPPLSLPPGFRLVPVPGVPEPPARPLDAAVAGDLRVLALPELAIVLRARRPGLDVTACVAVSGPRGAGLLRTGDTTVQLSAFAACHLAGELARVVPAAGPRTPLRSQERVQEVALDALLAGGHGTRLAGRITGTLHASVLAGARSDRAGTAVGSVEWVWDGGGWTGLEPRPSRAGRPQVGLVPVGPEDLPRWLAPLLAQAAA